MVSQDKYLKIHLIHLKWEKINLQKNINEFTVNKVYCKKVSYLSLTTLLMSKTWVVPLIKIRYCKWIVHINKENDNIVTV